MTMHAMSQHLRKAPIDGTSEGKAVKAFRVLTPDEQNLLIMYIQHGYNCAELARVMNANRCVVWQTIQRIRTKIKKRYDEISV